MEINKSKNINNASKKANARECDLLFSFVCVKFVDIKRENPLMRGDLIPNYRKDIFK